MNEQNGLLTRVFMPFIFLIVAFFLLKPQFEHLRVMETFEQASSFVGSKDIPLSYFAYTLSTFFILLITFFLTIFPSTPWFIRLILFAVFLFFSLSLYSSQNKMLIDDVKKQKQQSKDIKQQISLLLKNNKINQRILDNDQKEIENLKQKIEKLETFAKRH